MIIAKQSVVHVKGQLKLSLTYMYIYLNTNVFPLMASP